MPQLSALSGLLGNQLKGSASLTAEVTGTQDRPALALNLSANEVGVATSGAEHVDASMSATPTSALDNPDTRIKFAAKGRVEGLVVPEGVAVPPELGRDIDWSLAGDFCVDATVRSCTARGFETWAAADGHTVSDRPHLSAAKIIEHHNFIWSDLIAPGGAVHRATCRS